MFTMPPMKHFFVNNVSTFQLEFTVFFLLLGYFSGPFKFIVIKYPKSYLYEFAWRVNNVSNLSAQFLLVAWLLFESIDI